MDTFQISNVIAELERSGRLYKEFFRVPALSLGVYKLTAGAVDPQKPHTEDEIYYVLSGSGSIHVSGEDRQVSSGSVIFVKAGADHRFHSITQDLVLLVFFSPAESL